MYQQDQSYVDFTGANTLVAARSCLRKIYSGNPDQDTNLTPKRLVLCVKLLID